MTDRIDKDSLPLNQPRRTPSHPTKSHIVKTKVDGKEKIIRFGEQGASTAGKPKEGESDRMKAKRASFKSRHAKNIAKGPSSAAYWADKVKWADGGSVRTNYAEGDSVRAIPQNAALGKIAQALKSAKDYTNQYEVKPWVPLLGGAGVGDMLMGKAPEEVENWSYGNYPMQVPAMSRIPQFKTGRAESFADTVLLGADAVPVVGALGKVAGKAGKAGARVVGEELNRAILDNSGALAKLVPQAAKPMYAVKPKGGNWAPAAGSKDSVEASIQPLKGGETDPANKWLETKLQKYIRNDMGTPDDPIRLAHEKGYSHIPGNLAEEFGAWLPEDTAAMRRKAGYPEEGFAVKKHADAGYPDNTLANTRKAEMWENLADTEITASPAGAYQEQLRMAREMPSFVGNTKPALQMAERNPWIEKLDRDTPIYKIDSPVELNTNLGFGHMTDELRNMLDPASGLPANLRLTPEQLDKVTVKQMVERVSKVNDWRAEEAAKAEREGMMGNLTANARLEVPEAKLSFVDKPGMTWVDIPATTDESAKKLCTTIGRQAGWCTQGESLAKSYGSGENRLTTLIDAEGRPHAQAMLTESRTDPISDKFKELDQPIIDSIRANAQAADPRGVDWGPQGKFVSGEEADLRKELIRAETLKRFPEWAELKAPADIKELKPVGNEFSSARAREYEKRDPQYKAKITDSVLKFLNAGEWGKVNDLDHYDIADLQNPSSVQSVLGDVLHYDLPHERAAKFNQALDLNPDTPRFMSRNQLREFVEPSPPKGYAAGGLVGDPLTTYDPFQVDDIMNTIDAPRGYEEGGSVRGPDMEFTEDPEALRLYKHAMKQTGVNREETASNVGTGIRARVGGGDFSAGIDMNRMTQGERDQLMKSLAANYNVNLGDLNLNARVQKPLDAKDVYVGMLNGSIPLGAGQAMLGVQGMKTPYGSEVMGYNAGYSGKVGPGHLSVNVNKPKRGSPSGQVQYQIPFAEGGSVSAYDPSRVDAILNQFM